MSQLYDCRDAFAQTLEELARADVRVVVLANDSIGSSKLGGLLERMPERVVNIGIAEQNMVGIASGLANGGKIPFVCSAGSFLTARALEQIKVDLAYTNANVKLCAMSPGLAYGALGATHHSIEDIAWMRALANMTVIVPADPIETAQAMRAAAELAGPVYLRIARLGVPAVHNESYRFTIGKADCLCRGNDVTIITNGVLANRAVAAAQMLAQQGIAARVLNMATAQPLDREAIVQAAQETGAIVTAEEHTTRGGLGSAVAEVVVQTQPVPMRLLGIPGVFAPTGPVDWLLEHFGLTAQGIHDAALELLGRQKVVEP